jgi:glycosyltransferase involved in cell wall biosynthesis
MSTAAIIPVYNREHLIAQALKSIQGQTHPVDEIVVVDDASTDATAGTVTELSRHDSRIRLLSLEQNVGAAAARNIGVNSTKCDWIAFLDSDDEWMPQKLQTQFNALGQHPKAIASFTGNRFQYSGHYYDVRSPEEITLQQLRCYNRLGTTSSALIARDSFLAVGGFDPDLPSCQDWDLWINLIRVGRFATVPQALVFFNQREQRRISRNKSAVLAGHRLVFSRILQEVADANERRLVKAHHRLRLANIYLYYFDEPTAAAAAAGRSLLYHPTREGRALIRKALEANLHRLSDPVRGLRRRLRQLLAL